MDGGLGIFGSGSVSNTATLDTDNFSFLPYQITQGETVVVTHDAGSGSEKPVVYLADQFLSGSFTVDATNGAEAILDSFAAKSAAALNADGGTIDVSACSFLLGGSVAGTISNGGSLVLGLLQSATSTVGFTGTGQLEVKPSLFDVSCQSEFNQIDVTSFSKGDTILLDGLCDDNGVSNCIDLYGWTKYTDTTTTNANGTTDQKLTFYNSHNQIIDTFTVNGVMQGCVLGAVAEGTIDPYCGNVLNTTCNTLIECVCFLTGTHIATAGGERLVEDLRPGDLVRTFSGAIARVKWIGQRTVDIRSLQNPELAMPVRITAGAIAAGVPQRDLRVTPEHAVLVDGHLIPARLLINGSTIRLDEVKTYTFYHVELEQHDILLAEGMGAESYLDTGNRGMFANSDVVELFARVAGSALDDYNARACMKLMVDPAVTGAVWQALAERATLLGQAARLPATTEDAELAVFIGSRRLRPVFSARGRAAFALPAGAEAITIASRASMPWSLHPWLDDRRRLGVAVGRIVVRTADEVRDIAIDSPALGEGWWATEQGEVGSFRWTAGAAQLTLPASAGPSMLEFSLVGSSDHALVPGILPSAGQRTEHVPAALAG